MKKVVVGVAMLMMLQCANAQNWQEWTQQRKTQRKYLLQQIAALQVYLGYAKKGYDIANKGLTTIHRIKKGDFSLHDAFFSSLRSTKPGIALSAKVAAIISRQIHIITESRRTISAIEEAKVFTSEEKAQGKRSFENLLLACIDVTDELVSLTTSTELSLKDDERLKRIDALHQDMESKASFCFAYSTELGLLARQRVSEKVEITFSRKIK
ncbi:MAG: hypothetical protein EOP48_25645 [Sphingobacteriales bacterium]|nr:MAG: hypothetical protein EOP48_25645 [Sphingobacteriales bacterium]